MSVVQINMADDTQVRFHYLRPDGTHQSIKVDVCDHKITIFSEAPSLNISTPRLEIRNGTYSTVAQVSSGYTYPSPRDSRLP